MEKPINKLPSLARRQQCEQLQRVTPHHLLTANLPTALQDQRQASIACEGVCFVFSLAVLIYRLGDA